MGKKRTQREAEEAAAHETCNTVKSDLELAPVNGGHAEKKTSVKKKKEQRHEREGENVNKSRPEIEAEAANADSKHKKKKNEDLEGSNSALSKELPTVSIALPGSIIDNAQSLELATRLAGQIARAATIFRIDESILKIVQTYPWSPI
ncbi:unnamed protein product [Cuscuta campestris]|uniref:Uncharacterized protein n=1 Tax=Cuscuta campestris TaxID=132261 RepID=A0A484LU37_9ASTE|nr:unnamed protein product [Cuscuta campestris]